LEKNATRGRSEEAEKRRRVTMVAGRRREED
jgi:hypothetical protein